MKYRYYFFSVMVIASSHQAMGAEKSLLSQKKRLISYGALSTKALTPANPHIAADSIKEIMDYLPGSDPALQTLARYFEPNPIAQKKILKAFLQYLNNQPLLEKPDKIEKFFKTVRYSQDKNKLYHFFDGFHLMLPQIRQAIENADFDEFKRLCDLAQSTYINSSEDLVLTQALIETISYHEDSTNPFVLPLLNQDEKKKQLCASRVLGYGTGLVGCVFMSCVIYMIYQGANHLGIDLSVIIATPVSAAVIIAVCIYAAKRTPTCNPAKSQAMAGIRQHLTTLRDLTKQPHKSEQPLLTAEPV